MPPAPNGITSVHKVNKFANRFAYLIKNRTFAAKNESTMATAAGCSLGLVNSIDYSEQEIHFYSQARNIGCAEEAAVCMENSLDITPEDLVGGESVTVTWYLSNGKKE